MQKKWDNEASVEGSVDSVKGSNKRTKKEVEWAVEDQLPSHPKGRPNSSWHAGGARFFMIKGEAVDWYIFSTMKLNLETNLEGLEDGLADLCLGTRGGAAKPEMIRKHRSGRIS